jgi:hypothetical protein
MTVSSEVLFWGGRAADGLCVGELRRGFKRCRIVPV